MTGSGDCCRDGDDIHIMSPTNKRIIKKGDLVQNSNMDGEFGARLPHAGFWGSSNCPQRYVFCRRSGLSVGDTGRAKAMRWGHAWWKSKEAEKARGCRTRLSSLSRHKGLCF